MKSKDIVNAWAWIRKNNQSIPDDVLDLMKDAAIEKLNASQHKGGRWVRASTQLPPTKVKVIIRDDDGTVYDDIANEWDEKVTDYEWLDETSTPCTCDDKDATEVFVKLGREIDRLKGLMKELYVMYNREVMFPSKLEAHWKQFAKDNNI